MMNHVWSWVYDSAPPKEEVDPPRDKELWYIGEEDGTPTTVCKVHHFDMARQNATMNLGGVGAVATLIEHRAKGYGQLFMQEVVREMREAGHVVSNLYAFRDPWYAKLGYATCGWRWKIACPSHRLPKTKQTLEARQIAPEETSVLTDCHTQFVRQISGSAIRDQQKWKNRMGKNPPIVYALGNPVEAYLWVRMPNQFWGNVDVGELVWTTHRGYESALALLKSIGHNQTTLTWMEPPNSRYLARYYDQGAEMSMYRQTMYRVLDVEKAVRRLKPATSGSISIGVTDPLIEDNNGAWRIEWTPEQVHTERSPRADIAFDIQTFSQVFMGAPSFDDLALDIEVRNPNAIEPAKQLFTPTPVCCMEFF